MNVSYTNFKKMFDSRTISRELPYTTTLDMIGFSELSANKLSNNKLSDNNLVSELGEKRSFKPN